MSPKESSSVPRVRGTLFIHSTPAALCPHLEWAIGEVLGEQVTFAWRAQSALAGAFRSDLDWQAPAGTAARMASALRGWHYVRFEVVEAPSQDCDGARYQCTPNLGIHHSIIGTNGDVHVNEDRLRAALDRSLRNGTSISDEIDAILGTAWDRELEIFRAAAEDSALRWMPQTG